MIFYLDTPGKPEYDREERWSMTKRRGRRMAEKKIGGWRRREEEKR